MSISLLLLAKFLAAGLIVGFVTASIKSWVDRVFLVILLTGLAGLPIRQSISINILVVALSSLLLSLRHTHLFLSVREEWTLIIIPALLGGIIGRIFGLYLAPSVLMIILGMYALLVGLRLLLIKPMPERDDKFHPAWQTPISLLFGVLTGLISAGGKPFAVPIYNWILGHHPKRAYALSTVMVTVSAWAAVWTQVAVGDVFARSDLLLAVFAFSVITLTALLVDRFSTTKLNRVVTLLIAPVLMGVGIHFILSGLQA